MKLRSEWLCLTMNNATHPRTTRSARPNGRAPMRSAATAGYGTAVDGNTAGKHENVLLRREIGEVLRSVRQHQGRTLREVSDRIAVTEGVTIPDTVPDELVRQQGVTLR